MCRVPLQVGQAFLGAASRPFPPPDNVCRKCDLLGLTWVQVLVPSYLCKVLLRVPIHYYCPSHLIVTIITIQPQLEDPVKGQLPVVAPSAGVASRRTSNPRFILPAPDRSSIIVRAKIVGIVCNSTPPTDPSVPPNSTRPAPALRPSCEKTTTTIDHHTAHRQYTQKKPSPARTDLACNVIQ